MRKVVVRMMLSPDGYVEGPDHDLSRHLVDEERHVHVNEQLATISAFVEGRASSRTRGSGVADRRPEPGLPGGVDPVEPFRWLDLVDECRRYVNPVVIDRGRQLVETAGESRDLELVEDRRFGNGVLLRYAVRRPSVRRGAVRARTSASGRTWPVRTDARPRTHVF